MTIATRQELIDEFPAMVDAIGTCPEYTIHTMAENVWDIAFNLKLADAQDLVGMFYEAANKAGFAGSQF